MIDREKHIWVVTVSSGVWAQTYGFFDTHDEVVAWLRANQFEVAECQIAPVKQVRPPVDGAVGGGWQPIETAPKGDDPVFGFDGGRVHRMWWQTDAWVDVAGFTLNPTHWMPLPAPPEGSRGEKN